MDSDDDGTSDAPWSCCGTSGEYPVLSAEVEGDGTGTWAEFGRQLQSGPVVRATAGTWAVALTWTAVNGSAWTPPPPVTYAVYRTTGSAVEQRASGLSGLA